ncbi:unnamed protein product [Phytophthora fragariaefolia]|uniref:Unnamed protein product n=1 Tax=Phytophthora fragariaefolia TaxID=1490495 RepID=A0A9W7CQ79_9STRA|nr:unnamed protein product [Phytophthora fragariaefolia]
MPPSMRTIWVMVLEAVAGDSFSLKMCTEVASSLINKGSHSNLLFRSFLSRHGVVAYFCCTYQDWALGDCYLFEKMERWLKDYLAIALMTSAILEQFRISVPELKVTVSQTIAMSIISSAGATAFMMLMASLIGFPPPFALVIAIPAWFVVIFTSFAVLFGPALVRDASLLRELLHYIVVLVCQVLLTFVYPAYLYGFVHVGTLEQNFYLGLLTLIKLIAKNCMSYFLDNKYDLMPQIMTFNVDLFNALYLSSSMEISKSAAALLLVIALDVLLAWISMTDIQDLMKDIVLLKQKIPISHPLHAASFVEIAIQITREDDQVRASLSRHRYIFGLTTLKLP